VIGLLDPESEFVPSVLLRMIQPMLEAFDETIAVCGGGPVPAAAGLTSRWGALESLRAWLTRGAAFAGRNLVLPVPGGAVLAKRDAIIAARGFTGGALELIVRLHGFALASKKPYQIAFLPAPVSFGRTPRGLRELRQMVRRDQRELALVFRHRKSLAGPFAGRIVGGLYLDRSIRPKLEGLAYVLTVAGLVLGFVDWKLTAFVVLATAGIGIVQSLGAVVLREVAQPRSDPAQGAPLLLAAIPENLGYRQLRILWLIAYSFGFAAAKANRGSIARNDAPAVAATSTKK
jgi:hypothetical protein